MAKGARRKLKVFQAQFGFHDTVIAAPSRAAALRAWGTHQDLFATGQATLATDAKAVAAAVAHPGVVLRRAVGSDDGFEEAPAGLPKAPRMPPKATARASQSKSERPPKRAADRTALGRAEAAFRQIEDARKREEEVFRRREASLKFDKAVARGAHARTRKSAEAAVAEARRTYRNEGGTA